MPTLILLFQLHLPLVDALMQLLKKKITLREAHAFSHQKCPKIESLSLDPYIPNEKNQALKLLAAVIDLVLSSISELESTLVTFLL